MKNSTPHTKKENQGFADYQPPQGAEAAPLWGGALGKWCVRPLHPNPKRLREGTPTTTRIKIGE